MMASFNSVKSSSKRGQIIGEMLSNKQPVYYDAGNRSSIVSDIVTVQPHKQL